MPVPPRSHAAATPLLHDYLIDSAVRSPEKVALVCQGKRVTYRELDERSDALAGHLVEAGIRRGDRAIIFADNTVETVVSFWAVLKANAIVTVVNPLTKVEKLKYLLNDCRARVLLTDASLAGVFEAALAGAPHVAVTVVANELPKDRLEKLPGGVSYADAIARSLPRPPRLGIDIDLACIIYTSGSTGDPKGVMLTHRNMHTAATSITTLLENNSDDVIIGVLPLAFNYGLYQMIMSFKLGARFVLERTFAYPAKVLQVMVDEGVTGFPGVPTIFAILAELRDPSKFDLSKVRYITNTAAALAEKHIRLLWELFPNAKVHSMYGMTECKRCTYMPPEMLPKKMTSVGIAIPNTELWLVDENDVRLGPGHTGQLVIRGATVMKGYWEKPEETAKKLRPGPIPGEHVLYTGDLCRLDEDGYLYFVSRMDDIIKSRGEKVAPKEVESALYEIPGVRECAVIGVDDPILGQAIKAFVVCEEGATFTDKQIIFECQSRLESFMVPKHVEFVRELPKTITGKVMKTGLA